jgi:hypothetical protein
VWRNLKGVEGVVLRKVGDSGSRRESGKMVAETFVSIRKWIDVMRCQQ